MVRLATPIASVVEASSETFFGRQAASDATYVVSVPFTHTAPNRYSVEVAERQLEIKLPASGQQICTIVD